MKFLIYWTRWIFLIPVIAVIYVGFQTISYAIVIPYLHDMVIDDSPDTYEVLSHFLWNWILHPLVCLTIGYSSVYTAIKSAHSLVPSHKLQAIRVIAGLLLLLTLGNILMTLTNTKSHTLESILSAIAVNISAGVTALYFALSKTSEKEIIEKA